MARANPRQRAARGEGHRELGRWEDSLVLRVAAASAGGLPALVWVKDGKVAASAPFAKPLPREWTGVVCKWDGASASATLAGESVQMKLPTAFVPQTVTVQTSLVAALDAEGGGKFVLDWTKGYAARVVPGAKCSATSAALRIRHVCDLARRGEARLPDGAGEQRVAAAARGATGVHAVGRGERNAAAVDAGS